MHLVRANALHERNHGGEDHPVPCRTRQLSSPSPKVLRCSPWEDRPFRSCRAFPLSRALRALFLFGAMGPLPAGAAPLGRAARARCAVSLTFLFLRLNLFISLFFCVSVCSGSLVLTIGLSLLCSLRADHFGIAVSRSILESHLLFP